MHASPLLPILQPLGRGQPESADSATIVDGLKIGAIVGFLMWFGVDFIHYRIGNVSNLTATIADSLLELIRAGIARAVTAAVLGKIAGAQEAPQTE